MGAGAMSSVRVVGCLLAIMATAVQFSTPIYSATPDSDALPLDSEAGGSIQALNAKAQEFVNRGKLAFQSKDYVSAIENYSQALKLKPGDARLFYNRGLAYYKLDDLDRALGDFTDTVKMAPTLHFAWMNRANIYSRKKRFVEAVADYDKALALKSDDFLTWYNRGIAHGRLGDSKSALRDLNEALRLNPYDGASYSARADLFFTQGDLASAQADYKRALTIKPENKHAEQRLHELGKVDSGDPLIGIVVQPNKIDGNALSALASLASSACFGNGDNEDGLRTLAQTSGWRRIEEQDLKKNSGHTSSIVGGWTFDGTLGAHSLIQSRENVTPAVHVCTINSKFSPSVDFKAIRSALESSLKAGAADIVERGDQTTVGYWIPHTSTCEVRTALVYTRASQIVTIRMLHGRIRSSASGENPYLPIGGL